MARSLFWLSDVNDKTSRRREVSIALQPAAGGDFRMVVERET
jgi:hypothetical protein